MQSVVLKGRLGAGTDAKSTLRTLAGAAPSEPLVIREHGVAFQVDIAHGHKTGLYLDQRENRRLVRDLAGGRRVLNLFSYTGGFSLAAALGGARRTVSVDLAAPAIEAARENFALNGLSLEGHEFVAADVFEYLASADESFELVVLDPPSMAPNARARHAALRTYTRLNTAALGRAAPGALFLTASCSSHVSLDDFLAVLRDAALEARRTVRVIDIRGAGPDHPVPAGFPEGRYLKVVLAYVE